MLILLGTTVTASFFDSLNPSAIAQQMLLQAMVKNKRHIRFFILGIGLANYVLGLAVYYGLAARLSALWAAGMATYPVQVHSIEAVIGIICFAVGVRLLIKTRKSGTLQTEEAKTPKSSLTPQAIFVMGAAFCAVELTSALPYFGFLAVLASYSLAFPYVLGFILLYSLIYVAPLILLYFGYNKLQGTALIKKLEYVLGMVSAYVVPAAVTLLGILFLVDSVLALS